MVEVGRQAAVEVEIEIEIEPVTFFLLSFLSTPAPRPVPVCRPNLLGRTENHRVDDEAGGAKQLPLRFIWGPARSRMGTSTLGCIGDFYDPLQELCLVDREIGRMYPSSWRQPIREIGTLDEGQRGIV